MAVIPSSEYVPDCDTRVGHKSTVRCPVERTWVPLSRLLLRYGCTDVKTISYLTKAYAVPRKKVKNEEDRGLYYVYDLEAMDQAVSQELQKIEGCMPLAEVSEMLGLSSDRLKSIHGYKDFVKTKLRSKVRTNVFAPRDEVVEWFSHLAHRIRKNN